MKASTSLRLSALLLVALIPARSGAQAPAVMRDGLVDRMAGAWAMEGKIMGRAAHHRVQADWVLNHQFLRIQEDTDSAAPASERRYEATWFLGYDAVSERYVLHLLDMFGARFSETLGYGVRDGDAIRFTFEYPDGPFHTTFRWSPAGGTWEWLMEQKDKDGKWTTFAELTLARPAP
jgi:hypothetical protein